MSKQLPDIKTQFPEWYQEVIYQAELTEQSPVRGCVVIRPYGTAIWESIKGIMDKKIKDTGHENAIFPLLIPESFFKKEAEHVEGFAPELAIVTHAGGKKLAEPLVIRPTSETMVHHMFAKWIKSWRDLPLKINQWANVMRWEMRPRAFLRTSEFFWQEGHTAHATKEEAQEEVLLMLNEYRDLAENYLAIPVFTGRKSEGEKFPGAATTYTFEAFMPDGRALQMGTSHLLSQNFAKAFEMQFQDKEGELAYPWLTSWAVTTRLVGAIIMAHGDQKGLVLPPKIAPHQAVIIPIYRNDEEKEAVLQAARTIKDSLKDSVRIHIDADDTKKPGKKFFHWELRGVPFRIELGPRDLAKNECVIAHRLTGEKETVSLDTLTKELPEKLEAFQKQLFDAAKNKLDAMVAEQKTIKDIIAAAEKGGASHTGFCEGAECEKSLKQHKLSIRCLLDAKTMSDCFDCGKPSKTDCLVARSY